MKYKILITLSALVLLVFCSGITYSIFHSSSSLAATDQNIAKFVFNAENLDQLNLSLIDLNPGDTKDYLFSVSNDASSLVSDVSIEYQLTIKTYHIVPLVIELYRKNGEVEELILTCDENYTRNLQNELVCNSLPQQMEYSSSKLDDYKLKVSFANEYNDSIYSDLVDFINVEIKSWQKLES